MIQLKYAALFDIEFLHDYYADGKCSDLVIVPSLACELVMKQLGLRFIRTETGCKIFARVSEVNNKDLVNTLLPDNTRLTFLLFLQNPAFHTITQLSLKKKEKEQYYFNNLVNNTGPGNTAMLVADTTTKKLSDKDRIRFEKKSFQFAHADAVQQKTGEIRFTDSGEILSSTLDNNNDQFNFSFDLQVAGGGRAGFFINNINADNFYAADPSDHPGTFGVVEIFHRSTLPDTYRFINTDKAVQPKKYKITFANRQTTWRYVVNKKFNQQITNVNISKTNGTTLSFSKKAGTPDDQFILVSTVPIPLKQETVSGIRMTDQDDKEIIAHLPNPSATILKEEGSQLFSDIFITI